MEAELPFCAAEALLGVGGSSASSYLRVRILIISY